MEPKIFSKAEGIQEKVKAIIADKLSIDEKTITLQSNFINDLGADSLDVVELVMELEKSFSISIPDDEAEKISTVSEAIDSIKKKISSNN